MTEIWNKVRGYLAGGVAFITCPCHLLFTLPLLLSLTAGTALGAFLSRNTALVAAASTMAFVAGLALSFRWLGEEGKSCPVPAKRAKPAQPWQGRLSQTQTTQHGKEGTL